METRKKSLLLLAGVLALTLASKFPIVNNGFINRDDPAYITENPLIKDLSLNAIGKIFTTPDYMADYHPLTLTFFSIQYHFFRDHPQGYHAVSLLLHLLITAFVFLLAQRLSGSLPVAAITAAFFGIHPAHVESVAWASGQKDLLYGVFTLTSLLCYLRYIRDKRSKRFYAASLGFFVMAMLAKMMAAPLAVVLILVDYFFKRRFTRNVWLEKLPFFIAAILLGSLEIYAHREIATMLGDISYGAGGRVVLASYATIAYFGKLIAPFSLSAYYPFPFPPGPIPGLFTLFPLALLMAITACLFSRKLFRTILFGAGFFLLNIAVILQIVPAVGGFMADRYTYIASIGIFYLFAGGIVYVGSLSRSWRNLMLVAISLYILLLGISSWKRCFTWRDGQTLWTDVVEQYPYAAFMYVYRANARAMPADYQLAIADIRHAIQLQPDLGIAYYSRGYLESTVGNNNAAIEDYTHALALRYQTVKALTNRGSAYTSLGKYQEAIADYSSALQIDPFYTDAYFDRGNVYAATGMLPAAIADYDAALRLHPEDGEIYHHRGLASYRSGNRNGACNDFLKSASLKFPGAEAALQQYCR